jgi:membrane-associated protease RseP (regulator of RpoE activity)
LYSDFVERTDQPYLFPEFQPPPGVATTDNLSPGSSASELTAGRVMFHLFLFAATAATTTLTGAALVLNVRTEPSSLAEILLGPFVELLRQTVSGNLEPLANGLLFSFTLLTILGAHEFGHYFACRYYGIRATLPFFIPAPPLLTPFGTFGAVIKIKEQIRSRRALFDIGIAGPLAGFAFALPASVLGLMFAKAALPVSQDGGGLQFHDPPLFVLITRLIGAPHWIEWNPVYWAAWAAVLVTALNLFPVGQLDGGHVVYALFGRRLHRWVSLLACIAVAGLAVAAMAIHRSPLWILWTLILFFLLRVGHPPVHDEDEPLGSGRVAVAVIGFIVLLLCFMPFPIT